MTSKHGIVKAMDNDELRVMFKCNDKLGLVSVSLAVSPRYQFLNIYGTEASLFLDFLNKTLIKQGYVKGIPKSISRCLVNISSAKKILTATIRNAQDFIRRRFTPYDGMEILIREFYRSITEGTKVPVSGEEGINSMRIMDKIWSQI